MKGYIFSIIFVFLLTSLLAGCSSKNETLNLKKIEGTIIIVGNEPFTQPALKVSDDKSYIIECSEEERKILFNNQGEKFVIYYNILSNGPNGETLKMVKSKKQSEK
ncbi:MAG: hypothetical protein PVH88_22505 [Ignavibacteria bacterium]|jgi:uncharacterized protein YcfL